jgi:creatinine amidohydrolase
MRWYDLTWMQLERYLESDDRVVVPLGSVEQHAYLSLGTDAILAERAALDAAEPLGVPVLPAMPFGLAPNFTAFPGTISLRIGVYLEVVRDILDALAGAGFRRILLVNGHAGNSPADALAKEWRGAHPETQVVFNQLLLDPKIWAAALAIEPEAGHASWVENFPWTRVEGSEPPAERKPAVPPAAMRSGPQEARRLLGDGNTGGPYAVDDERMLELWQAAVADVRTVLESGWPAAA